MDCGPSVQACPGNQLRNHIRIHRSIEPICGTADPEFRRSGARELTGEWLGKSVNPVRLKGPACRGRTLETN